MAKRKVFTPERLAAGPLKLEEAATLRLREAADVLVRLGHFQAAETCLTIARDITSRAIERVKVCAPKPERVEAQREPEPAGAPA